MSSRLEQKATLIMAIYFIITHMLTQLQHWFIKTIRHLKFRQIEKITKVCLVCLTMRPYKYIVHFHIFIHLVQYFGNYIFFDRSRTLKKTLKFKIKAISGLKIVKQFNKCAKNETTANQEVGGVFASQLTALSALHCAVGSFLRKLDARR